MSLPQLKQMPSFHITVSHPPDTPQLMTSNFHYKPYQSTHEGKKDITSEELMSRTEEALAWLKAQQISSPFGFIFEDGTYDIFPSNECLGLINCPKRFIREGKVVYFISVGYSGGDEKSVDWLINRSPYSPAFVTKDAKEALSKGIILNTKHCTAFTVAAVRTFLTLTGGTGKMWMEWAKYVPEDLAWVLTQYCPISGDVVTLNTGYSWSGTMAKNIGIDGIKRFLTHDYSLHDTTPMSDKPFRYEDFSHLWRTRDKKVHVPFEPGTEVLSVKKKNTISNKEYTQTYENAMGNNVAKVAENILNYIGYPYV